MKLETAVESYTFVHFDLDPLYLPLLSVIMCKTSLAYGIVHIASEQDGMNCMLSHISFYSSYITSRDTDSSDVLLLAVS